MRKILVAFCLALLVSLPVCANTVIIDGVGEIELGQDITMTENHNKNGESVYNFMVKDRTVWRGAMLMPIKTLGSSEVGAALNLDFMLNKIINDRLNKGEAILATDKIKEITLGGKTGAATALKMSVPGAGFFIANVDIWLISASDRVKLFVFMCADSDTQYWRPIMQNIAAQIP